MQRRTFLAALVSAPTLAALLAACGDDAVVSPGATPDTGGTDPTNPEYYRLTVEYAMRLTWSGEFLHAAPWSEGSQGYANVSHGCTGMSTENAAWLYDISNIGDVYEYVGNDRMMTDDGNGITLWNVAWEDWLADSKAGAVRTTKL